MSLINIDNIHGWRSFQYGKNTVHAVGRMKSLQGVVDNWPKEHEPDLEEFAKLVSDAPVGFACIIETKENIFVAADKIRSYPVFYSYEDGFTISNTAFSIRESTDSVDLDIEAALQLLMSGYVTGAGTLYRDIKQIQAGECLVFNKRDSSLCVKDYYLFYDPDSFPDDEASLLDLLDQATHDVFSRTVEDAGGRPIWVPLSGGLDSRLVLCRLKALHYEPLRTFSYGVPGNYEAKIAQEVAEKVDVPWTFIPCTAKRAREFERSNFRKRYDDLSGMLCAIPFPQDIQVLWENEQTGVIPRDAVIVNGQSGDFITGGHLPTLSSGSVSGHEIIEKILSKHFSFWTGPALQSRHADLSGIISRISKINRDCDYAMEECARLLDLWEWRERQSKYVVNGQRNYDIFGYAWALPLWDDEYLRFWSRVPYARKYKQSLYKKYLMQNDYFGLFRDFDHTVWRWPGMSIAVVPVARLVKLLLGKRAGDLFYKLFMYWGHTHHLYARYGYAEYLRHFPRFRNFHALAARRCLEKLGLSPDAI